MNKKTSKNHRFTLFRVTKLVTKSQAIPRIDLEPLANRLGYRVNSLKRQGNAIKCRGNV